MQQRALSSWLTGLSMALGVALVVSVLVIHSVVSDTFRRTAQGYDLIVGAKGGALQLVLNTVFHLSKPINNIPYSYYKEFTQDEHHRGKYARYVNAAVPYCLGDSYDDFRVVGTTPQLFDEFEYANDRKYQFAQGRNFKQEGFFEGVIGSLVAHKTKLKVGDTFNPTHGVAEEGLGHKHDAFTVVGILAPTGTPNDRALFVNMEGFYLLDKHAKDPPEPRAKSPGHAHDEHGREHPHDEHTDDEDGHDDHADDDHDAHEDHDGEHAAGEHEAEHDEHEHDAGHDELAHDEHDVEHDHDEHDHGHGPRKPLPEDQREVTAILLQTRINESPLQATALPNLINDEPLVQAVMPAREILMLFDSIVNNIKLLLLVVAYLVVVVAGIGVMVSIYNSMNDRRHDIAIMRSLGARRQTVMLVILLESVLLSLGGGVAGLLLGHVLMGLISPLITAETGVPIGFFQFHWSEPALVPGLIAFATLVGFLPSTTAYRTDVAKALSLAP
jgi:putative ABC transport system permease protein